MNREVLIVDGVIAVVIAALVLVLSPGLAISGVLALLVLLVCAITALVGRRRRARRLHPPPTRRRQY